MKTNHEELKNRLFDLLINGIYVFNIKQGLNTYINDSYTAITGYKLEEINNMSSEVFFGLFHPDDQQNIANHMEEVLNSKPGEVVDIEYRFKHKNGNWIWCLSKDLVIDREVNDKPIQFMGSFIDITESKVYQSKLLQANQDLENFASVVSHDLQNPLNTIIGFSKLAKRDIRENHLDNIEQYIDFISNSSNRLKKLISGMLENAKLSGELVREEINVNELIEKILSDLDISIKQKKANIKYKDLPKIFANQAGLVSLFQNIISNSLKYSDTNRTPIIEIASESNETEWVFRITDNGIGIPKDKHKKIFENSVRGSNVEHIQGNGIGLAQCLSIVNLHNGDIWIESKAGVGTSVFFSICKEF